MREISVLLKNRNFVHLWTSQIISQLVINTISFLMLIHLFEKTHSTIATSLVWVAYALPAIIVGPFASVTADLVDKRKVLVTTLMAQSLIVIVYALTYSRFTYLAYGIVFFYSLVNQFYIPTEAAAIPLLVKKSILPFANSLFFVTVQSGLAVGSLFAGILYEYIGLGRSLAVSSVLLLVAVSSVSLLPKLKPLEQIPKDIGGGAAKFFGELLEGYQFIKDTRSVFLPFMLLIGLQVALSVIVVTVPVMAEEIVRVRPSLSGFMIIIPAVFGALIATMFVPRLISRGVQRKRMIETSLFSLSLVLILLGAVVPATPFWIGRTLAVLCFAIAGASYVGSMIPTLTHLQISTPKDKLGRVFGSIWFITTAATVLPVVFSATLTEVFGVSLMLTLVGIGGLIAFFTTEVTMPGAFQNRMRRLIKTRTK